MAAEKIVTRFAPSPTGYLHIGGARTALFNWAVARRFGGQFLVRLEDTDQARSSDAAAESILEDLRWLGLDWDNAGKEPRQSQRLELYNKHIEKLLADGRAYRDKEDPAGKLVRFKTPGTAVTIVDEIRGAITTPAEQLEDIVIRKSDGFPTFHLAVVVDDEEMGVTHVIRGQDHLTNTPKHWALQEALGFGHPIYMHISLTVNPDGSKLGKRDKAKHARKAAKDAPPEVSDPRVTAFLEGENDDVDIAEMLARKMGLNLPEIDVRDFRASGYLPEVLVNFLGLLGWNPGNDVERFGSKPLEFMKENFDPKRFVKANATFDRQKLAKFNAEAIAALPSTELQEFIWSHNQDVVAANQRFAGPQDEVFAAFCEAYRQRSSTLSDPVKQGAFFFADDDEIVFDANAVAKVLEVKNGEGFAVLGELTEVLESLEPWRAETIETRIKQFAEQKQLGMGKVAQPIRVAVSGTTVSPPIGLTLEILGKASTIVRINRCLEQTNRSK